MIDNTLVPGADLGDDYTLCADAPRLDRSGRVVAEVQLWHGGALLHGAEMILIDDRKRDVFAAKAVELASHIDVTSIKQHLLDWSVSLRELLRAQSRGNSSAAGDRPREQLSLAPPGYVCVALDDDGNRVYICRLDDGTLNTASSVVGPYRGETVLHTPPPELPWPLPRASAILEHFPDVQQPSWAAHLLTDLEQWHRDASDLARPEAYLLLALYDMLTYVIEQSDYMAIILLEGEAERGKSRTGCGVVCVSRHGMHLEGLRESHFIRDASDRQATLFIDLMNAWATAVRQGCEDVLLGRWERGGVVPRVLYPDRGPFADTVYYHVYGPTIVATNEPVHRILGTRALRIDMPLSNRTFSGRLRPEAALPLVERLMAWRAYMVSKPLVGSDPPTDGRLGDILRPLHQVLLTVAPTRAAEFEQIVQWQTERRTDEHAAAEEAEVVRVLLACSSNHGYVYVHNVWEAYNHSAPDDEKRSPRWIGGKLRRLGCVVERVGHQNRTAVRWDGDLFARLAQRHGLPQSGDRGDTSHASHASRPTDSVG